MKDVAFYHLTRSTAEQALPQLLGRTLALGRRALVRCRDAARVEAIDQALWRAPEPIWLPHGTAASGEADLQPIWIAADDAVPNRARFLFLVDGAEAGDVTAFDRVFDLFDGNDAEQLAAARLRWTAMRGSGANLSYWRQEQRGWVRAA